MELLDKLTPIADRIALFGGGATPFDTVIDEVCSPAEVIIGGRRTLLCGSNNYLGLSVHPSAVADARAANGTFAAHRRLEDAFARLYGMRHAMVFTTGYQANLGVISGLCNADDVVLLDVESHASIYDGARLSGARVFAFRHNSAADLARKRAKQPDGGRCLVVVEGLFSISGDVAPLPEIVAACRALIGRRRLAVRFRRQRGHAASWAGRDDFAHFNARADALATEAAAEG